MHPQSGDDREAYVEAVLRVVEAIPPGRVVSYGAVAAAVRRGGPRQVGRVMATYGGTVPWWRVVRADGTLPPSHARARHRYQAEGTPLIRGEDGQVRVDMTRASWVPQL